MEANMNYLEQLFERADTALGKKLSTKDRKKLKSGTFCGPGRSFPIPDCKHVAVAKTYLGRAKFSAATKAKIAACINRKAKSLKCNTSKKAKAEAENRDYALYVELSSEEKRLYSSDVFAETKALVDKSIETPELDLTDMEWPEEDTAEE
jgi:hypothetical protein